MLQLISLVMLAYSFFLIQTSIPTLPKCIPTHFNAAGEANAWGSPDMLWFLLGAQALTFAVFLIVPYLGQSLSPRMIHLGSRRLSDFPASERTRILLMLHDMSAYMSIVMNVFFVLMLLEIIRAAGQPEPRIHPLFPMALLLVGIIGTLSYYTVQFHRLAKSEDGVGHPPNAHGPQLAPPQPDVWKKGN